MALLITVTLLATIAFLGEACTIAELSACAKSFTDADQTDLGDMCRGAALTTECLEPKTANCAGNFMFESLTNSMNTMNGFCKEPNPLEGLRRKREAGRIVGGIKKIMI